MTFMPDIDPPTLEERWEVLEGTLQLKLDGHWRWLTADNGPARVAPKVLPAGQLEEFLTAAAQAARFVR